MAKQKSTKIYEVKPLKTQEEVDDMRQVLRGQGSDFFTTNRTGRRNLMLFDLGCLTGLRVSDIVGLRVKDVIKGGVPKIREVKTRKRTHTYINKALLHEIKQYVAFMHLKPEDWLFPSRKKSVGSGHISTTQVYRFLVEAGDMLGRHDIGTHTMRKTFGWQYYKSGGRIEELQQILNHTTPAVTRRYLGLDQEDINNKLKNFHF